VAFIQARWLADGCISRVRGVIASAERETADSLWRTLDASFNGEFETGSAGSVCTLTFSPVGTRLNVNTIDALTLQRLARRFNVRPGAADSVVDALLDWRDPDDETRPNGSEARWYRDNGLPVPRNGPLADARELRHVRGLSDSTPFIDLLDVEEGRISLSRADPQVLAVLPGFTPELVAQLLERRTGHNVTSDLNQIATLLSGDARAVLLANISDVQPIITGDPDAWVVASHIATPGSRVDATVEVKLVRGGRGGVIVRRKELWN
jgi:type II secretory pathway component PulK